MKKKGYSPYNILSCKATVTKYDIVMGLHRSVKQNKVHRQTSKYGYVGI